ncbi:YrrS family protein [Jeotgalibaca sp. MA1X17-3]|uniref:YrrS family protein n=1 Tax=Jeotgalibaca sp. MA1X17-3 TaxID=2908211 RepID=UPI001F2F8C0B|nr:YrrS family protein [Jeotgalibaca sp. MA1X17-3]UJF16516.1 YrrS family protein [Jeotgalibaca sp. MA1X17-3]
MSNNNNENQNETRKERYKSNENPNMLVKLSIGLAGLLVLALVFNYFLGGSNEDPNQVAGASDQNEFSMINKNSGTDSSQESVTSSETQVAESSSQKSDKEEAANEEKEKDLEEKQVETNDSNVKKAIVANWEPIGTKQSEPHVTSYEDGSQDRLEIKEAVSQVTGVNGNDMIVNWVGNDTRNDGVQRVTSTITQSSTGMIYKVYLQWVPNEGWKVNRVEELYTVIR